MKRILVLMMVLCLMCSSSAMGGTVRELYIGEGQEHWAGEIRDAARNIDVLRRIVEPLGEDEINVVYFLRGSRISVTTPSMLSSLCISTASRGWNAFRRGHRFYTFPCIYNAVEDRYFPVVVAVDKGVQ